MIQKTMLIALPLKIRRHAEAYEVKGADDRPVAFVYFENEASRQTVVKRLTEPEALDAARRIARALSEPDEGAPKTA